MRNDEFRRVKDLAAMEYGLFKDKGNIFLNNLNTSCSPPLSPKYQPLCNRKERKKISFSYLQSLEEVQYSRVRFQVAGEMPPSFTFPDGTGL